ncbi:hypothetical protein [Aneurinibacillus aneurinilyticus]|uniref:Uncharacterized protein n=1 Tax=Aneurinibacillus aneurinilyticus ATCC 12856 TaxID=649747 RepID=U1WXF6_ANEAE|nr:hypothetical protein [Aneurinibacillus aneurinilyticus]ERI06938.1 hypothetical protein HMPREF0083_04962 [Aneurinibacillus aneurinilyticus ATCC 12856]MED0707876.1 hypothetical protein [Aneurinibacillus aneurinilyticus]MED0722289.1 hypothetical protein [Aneurinibacillus aneurinilyticus]MED0734214.1 hypothetical protein [Aneurinibacillus aneurinilyticus]MED0742327.1 hypothetical protein [Aneurinibacillus aneurinilyticus]
MDLEDRIKHIKQKIEEKQALLAELEAKLTEYKSQQEQRKHYMASKEIIDYIEQRSGKIINMSTIKRWTDEGYLGEVIDEREHFWALKTKQGKKRNLYKRATVFPFLYARGYIFPYYDILDEVLYLTETASFPATVTDIRMEDGQFLYKIQLPDYTIIDSVNEKQLKGAEPNGKY